MKKFEKGGTLFGKDFFVCTSEKEIELVGTLDSKGALHASNQVPECIAKAVRIDIKKEVGATWQNDHH